MRHLIIMLVLLIVPIDGQAAGDQVAALIKRGDEAYAKRFSNKATWRAIGFYRQARKLDAKNYEVLWRLARAYFWLADNTSDEALDRKYGDRGYRIGLKAAKLKPNRVEAHFWAAVCIGEYAKGIGIITALSQGIEKKFRRPLDRAMKINAGYTDGGPHRTYGVYYHRLPWPKRDNDKALKHLRKALRYNLKLPRTHFYIAQVLEAEDKHAQARMHLKRCLAINPKQGDPPDNYRYQWHCRQLRKTIGK